MTFTRYDFAVWLVLTLLALGAWHTPRPNLTTFDGYDPPKARVRAVVR